MQKRTHIITKMHRPHLLYPLSTPHSYRHCIWSHLRKGHADHQNLVRSRSSKITVRSTIYCSFKILFINRLSFVKCSSSMFFDGSFDIYNTCAGNLHIHTPIFDIDAFNRSRIYIRILWSNFTSFGCISAA
jgi:hypothetical protein